LKLHIFVSKLPGELAIEGLRIPCLKEVRQGLQSSLNLMFGEAPRTSGNDLEDFEGEVVLERNWPEGSAVQIREREELREYAAEQLQKVVVCQFAPSGLQE
jgi:hypothetical protein